MSNEPSKLCQDFITALASPSPTPGGGGAAALCGALAASLGCMAGSIRRERCKDEAKLSLLAGLLSPCEGLRQELLALMDADARAFQALSPAYALPKDAPGRAEAICRLSLEAARPPLAMLRAGAETVQALEALLPHVGKLLISDIACGASLAAAAMETAAINVFVNTGPYRHCPEAARLQTEAEQLLAAAVPRARALSQKITEELKGA